ncbi:MAG: hypothetical protein WBG71_01235 [Leeuwenhoekiella sp.]
MEIGYFLIVGFLVAISVVFFTMGFRQKRKPLQLTGVAILVLAVLIFIAQFPKILNVSKSDLFEVSPRRTGVEVFEEIFNEKPDKTITILHAEDRIVPSIDYAAVLHFSTSPEKMDELIKTKKFGCIVLLNAKITSTRASEYVPWFRPGVMSESISVCTLQVANGNSTTLYINDTYTEAYCFTVRD